MAARIPKGNDTLFMNLSCAYLILEDNPTAVEWGQRAVGKGTKRHNTYAYLAMANANLGQMEKTHHYADEYIKRTQQLGRKPGPEALDDTKGPAYVKYCNESYLPKWRKAGLPE